MTFLLDLAFLCVFSYIEISSFPFQKCVTFYSKEEAQAERHESFLHEEESLSWVWSCGRV